MITDRQPHEAITIFKPGEFKPEDHWYPRALNATIHPLMRFFLKISQERMVSRYCHLHPMVNRKFLTELLQYKPKYLWWSGTDIINVTSSIGQRQMVVIETNSSPSGQKSMPHLSDYTEYGGYLPLMENSFKLYLKGKRMIENGVLAVIYDKNQKEASGYASAMAEAFQEEVYAVLYYTGEEQKHIRYSDGKMEIKVKNRWKPIRALFRYLTQKPWNRLPIGGKSIIYNPIIACLAGGRNKLMASKAYEFFNAELNGTGLHINAPETVWDVNKTEIPLWVRKFGGHAVIKIPYSNAGQGVFTITNQKELDDFMEQEFEYQKFIVQSLIGNFHWSSSTEKGRLYQVGTMPDKLGNSYVSDLRCMIYYTAEGYRPLCMYSRKAALPLKDVLDKKANSWEILGTNLSIKTGKHEWDSDTNRLILMDLKDFNQLGLGIDDLIESYIQSILATIAIDKLADKLMSSTGGIKKKLFQSLNPDKTLMEEILNI
ncbi:hypothetical protein [Xanthovirga aplysinae]|uniref:hypothetical protein n=1 Tax=Xanthovirga aplysinae TaxID=2529853 RepID=UPI0012BBDD51|nr:hypothetical protein [Xanthovirga aplysinae]MTI33222.1 hypothetical protein [Xanthovirga aplysinae]